MSECIKLTFLAQLKTVFVWVSKKTPGPTQQPQAASHDSWITAIPKTIFIPESSPQRVKLV